ncbi:MAG: phosphoribosyltransferase regulatory subunit [Eubacteriales bacterium]|nr:phosphoribosyltransferase regulatory subunit [Eubacteriales bacterium]MDN5364126.1 phosphoribosyltransferase regulatory subunit [Eubacteriales bacterium]
MSNGKERAYFQIPPGMKDWLPGEAEKKRRLENVLADLFSVWGYREVITPAIEYLEVLTAGHNQEEMMYKFFDHQGRALALRPDMTTPIARLAATRLKQEPLPLRLFYLAGVFGQEDPQKGRQREYHQAGVELIGSGSGAAVAEVLALAVEALRACGLKEFTLSAGHVGVFNGLVDWLGLPPEARQELREAVQARNFVAVELILNRYAGSQKEAALTILRLRGGREILPRLKELAAGEAMEATVAELEEIFSFLAGYGVEDYITLDLGLLRGLGYYTGLVFEGFSPALGYPILGGGSYGHLLGRFGWPQPAVGFALGLERVLLALEREQPRRSGEGKIVYVGYAPGREKEAIALALRLREEGKRTVLAVAAEEKAVAEEQARRRRGELVYLG